VEPLDVNKNPFEGKPGGDVVEYPVSFELKVILNSDTEDKIHRRNLELVLEDTNVKYSFIKSSISSKGSYISITMEVVMVSESQMHQMYEKLKLLPGIRFAI